MKSRDAEWDRLYEGAVERRDAARNAFGDCATAIIREVSDTRATAGRRTAEKNSMPESLVGLRGQIGMGRKL